MEFKKLCNMIILSYFPLLYQVYPISQNCKIPLFIGIYDNLFDFFIFAGVWAKLYSTFQDFRNNFQ